MPDAVAWDTVARAARGDDDARRALVEDTVDDLWSLAMRLTRQADEADDVVQETYSRMFATIGTLRPDGRFEGYLARIATNLVLERWRRSRPQTPVAEAALADDALEPWQTVADAEDERRRLAAVWASVGQLEPKARAAVLLFYAQGDSCDHIGRILDVPAGTVKTWLYRARNQVREGAQRLLGREPALGRNASGDLS